MGFRSGRGAAAVALESVCSLLLVAVRLRGVPPADRRGDAGGSWASCGSPPKLAPGVLLEAPISCAQDSIHAALFDGVGRQSPEGLLDEPPEMELFLDEQQQR